MYAAKTLVLLAAAGAATASIIAERSPFGLLDTRSISQGWSIQAGSAPAGSVSCGSGSYCPSSLKCNPAANDEVAACCTGGDCRGDVEGAPACADSSWSLWKGLDGNGFCCAVGMIGIYDYHNPVAGTCVSSAGAGATTAVIVSTGSGSAPKTTAAPAKTTAAPESVTSAAAADSSSTAAATASGSDSASSSGAAAAATSAAPVASGNSTTSSTSSAAGTKATNGAEKLAGGLSVFAFGVMAVLAL